jgi:hypothetical protein
MANLHEGTFTQASGPVPLYQGMIEIVRSLSEYPKQCAEENQRNFVAEQPKNRMQ